MQVGEPLQNIHGLDAVCETYPLGYFLMNGTPESHNLASQPGLGKQIGTHWVRGSLDSTYERQSVSRIAMGNSQQRNPQKHRKVSSPL
jgi:hypothetical protein